MNEALSDLFSVAGGILLASVLLFLTRWGRRTLDWVRKKTPEEARAGWIASALGVFTLTGQIIIYLLRFGPVADPLRLAEVLLWTLGIAGLAYFALRRSA